MTTPLTLTSRIWQSEPTPRYAQRCRQANVLTGLGVFCAGLLAYRLLPDTPFTLPLIVITVAAAYFLIMAKAMVVILNEERGLPYVLNLTRGTLYLRLPPADARAVTSAYAQFTARGEDRQVIAGGTRSNYLNSPAPRTCPPQMNAGKTPPRSFPDRPWSGHTLEWHARCRPSGAGRPAGTGPQGDRQITPQPVN